MRITLDRLVVVPECADPAVYRVARLRELRDEYQEIESGLSFVRRMAQGRIDVISAEIERRSDATSATLLARLPEALSSNLRGAESPRPVADLVPPEWAHDVVVEVDSILSPTRIAQVGLLETAELVNAARELASVERALSDARRAVQATVDALRSELVSRYRVGVPLDDILA